MKYSYPFRFIQAGLISLIIAFTATGQIRHNTVIYAIKNDGTLWYYNYKGALNGSSEWDTPTQIGTGWQNFVDVFSAKGKIYAIKEDGTLWWYYYKGMSNGVAIWDGPKQVGTGWQGTVFSSNGRIYRVTENGTLLWHNHLGATDGSFRWEGAKQVGNGWQTMTRIFDCGGNIYAVNPEGGLLWYHHTGAAGGSQRWDGAKQVGTGWQDMRNVFGSGRIYAIKEDGTLWWYRHTGASDGGSQWDTPKQIGTGWGDFIKVFPLLTDDLSDPVAPSSPSQATAPTITTIGAIADKYNSLGGLQGLPGKPTANELPTADGTGRYQKFEHCIIFWHPSLGAHEVHGAIAEKYLSLNDVKNIGYPTTDQLICSDGAGRYNIFKKLMSDGKWAESAIYWFPKVGAWQIYGAIWQKWKADGAEKGSSGYPTGAQSGDKNYSSQDFQRRKITYTPSKGAVVELYNTY